MIKLFAFFTLCFALNVVQAQNEIDIAKVISGTYRCSAHIGTFGKDDVDKDRVTVRIRKTGENKVSVSMDGATTTYEVIIAQRGPQSIGGDAMVKGMHAHLVLELDKKPATIRGGNANDAATKENKEVWWFEGTANEDKAESLVPGDEKEEGASTPKEEKEEGPHPPEKKPIKDIILEGQGQEIALPPNEDAVKTGQHVYKLDNQGRPIAAEGWLYGEHGVRVSSAQRSVSAKANAKFDIPLQNVPIMYNPKIHAGHIIAKQFGGSGEKYNLIPIKQEANLSILATFERNIRKEMQTGQNVYMQAFIFYNTDKQFPKSITYKAFKSDGKKLVKFANADDIIVNILH